MEYYAVCANPDCNYQVSGAKDKYVKSCEECGFELFYECPNCESQFNEVPGESCGNCGKKVKLDI